MIMSTGLTTHSVSTPEGWTPQITADLNTISGRAFNEQLNGLMEWFVEHLDDAPELDTVVKEGWNKITPYMAEVLLWRFRRNRKVSLTAVSAYARRMKAGRWAPTGEPICTTDVETYNGFHRLLACLLSGVPFVTYVVTSVPETANIFAYYDNGKTRTPAEVLRMGGENGLSAQIAAAIKVAFRYDNDALSILGQPPIRQLDNMETYDYSMANPVYREAAHTLAVNYMKAARTMGHNGIAVFAAAKILSLFGEDVLKDFMVPLGLGANLDEDSPILALRNRLQGFEDSDDDLKLGHRLALIIKAFIMHHTSQVMPRTGRNRQNVAALSLTDVEPYPRFEDALPQEAEAAQ